MGGGEACGRSRCEKGVPTWVVRRHADAAIWGLGWVSPWGHDACEVCAGMRGGEACGRSNGGLRWSSLWGHET
eukprot:5310609-Pyramimonas_sp.AAC.1